MSSGKPPPLELCFALLKKGRVHSVSYNTREARYKNKSPQQKGEGCSCRQQGIGDSALGGSRLGCPGTANVRGDEQEPGIRRIRRDESAGQDKVLYPLKAYP